MGERAASATRTYWALGALTADIKPDDSKPSPHTLHEGCIDEML